MRGNKQWFSESPIEESYYLTKLITCFIISQNITFLVTLRSQFFRFEINSDIKNATCHRRTTFSLRLTHGAMEPHSYSHSKKRKI